MKMIRNIYCLHSKNIMHYDIKLENCVFFPINADSKEINLEEIEEICDLNKDFTNDVKLIDFGFAERVVQNKYLKKMPKKGTPTLMYGKMNEKNEKGEMYHSRFLDIFAILKDLNNWLKKLETSEIFGKFKNLKVKINGEMIPNIIYVEDDLPDFLNDQRKLLEQPDFNPEPYQNILTQLKKEYDVLDRPRKRKLTQKL